MKHYLHIILSASIAIACVGCAHTACGQTGTRHDTDRNVLAQAGILDSNEVTDDAEEQANYRRPAMPAFRVPDTNFPTGWIPQRTMHMVNDYTGILTTEQRNALERRLLDCEDSSGVQILLLVTPDLGGDEIAHFTQRVWENWGIGDKKLNNGLVMVVKPKNSTNGHVRIQTGYGLEGALPDAFCGRIIEDLMIPCFQENDYYGGIDSALDIIIPVCRGEYNYDQYREDHEDGGVAVALIIVIGLAVLMIWLSRNSHSSGNGSSYNGGYGGPFFGGWYGGGFQGGGGFHGWGGGSSGGGGASGSW